MLYFLFGPSGLFLCVQITFISEVIIIKREEKNALSRQRILDAALQEFSAKGYDAASLNVLCAENDISKGLIYHYFKDKDELYLTCAADCFEQLTSYLKERKRNTAETAEEQLQSYFSARLQFFAEHPMYLGIFLGVVLNPPEHLTAEVAATRKSFDLLNASTLTELLNSTPLRKGLTVSTAVEDFRMYMDYFNARFRTVLAKAQTPEQALREHEERCHRQLDILLHGVIGEHHE